MQVEVLDLGARIAAIRVPTTSGTLADVILGYNDHESYINDPFNMGSTVGRYANRIESSSFRINDQKIELSKNEGNTGNHIHGGFIGFDKKTWSWESYTENSITLTLHSTDGEEGYPGNLSVKVKYVLTKDNQLQVHYWANTDKPTLVNLTNHAYFNLADKQENIDSHEIVVYANTFSPLDENHLPKVPYIQQVDNTVYDLRTIQSVKDIKGPICNINYFTNTDEEPTIKEIALVKEAKSGRQLRIYSDYPAMQLYFAEFLSAPFTPFQGLCCEPHYAPNSPNIESYKSAILLPSEEFVHKIYYSFEKF